MVLIILRFVVFKHCIFHSHADGERLKELLNKGQDLFGLQNHVGASRSSLSLSFSTCLVRSAVVAKLFKVINQTRYLLKVLLEVLLSGFLHIEDGIEVLLQLLDAVCNDTLRDYLDKDLPVLELAYDGLQVFLLFLKLVSSLQNGVDGL